MPRTLWQKSCRAAAFALQLMRLRCKSCVCAANLPPQTWLCVANLGVILQLRCLAARFGLQWRCVVICALTCASMLTGFRALPLLCKTTQMLPADVVQLVQECLRLHVGKRCPAWIDSLFVQQLQGFGMDSEVIFTVCAVRHINLAHDWAWLNVSSSDNKDEDAKVTVKFTIYP